MSTVHYPSASFLRELQQDLLPFIMGCKSSPLDRQTETAWQPKVDVKETNEAFIVYMDVPGVEPKDITIDMEDKILSIKGERQISKEEKGENHYHLERVSGKFYRKFTLPESIDENSIAAKVKHGVLTLQLPKAKESKTQRKISVEEE